PAHEPELAEDRRRVEVDALADDPLPLELEDRERAAGERAAGGGDAAEWAEVRSLQVELDDHGAVRVMHPDQLVALVRERRARLGEVARDLVLAVVDVAGRDDLVARVAERGHRHIELVPVL